MLPGAEDRQTDEPVSPHEVERQPPTAGATGMSFGASSGDTDRANNQNNISRMHPFRQTRLSVLVAKER